jgi:hypothetical protein
MHTPEGQIAMLSQNQTFAQEPSEAENLPVPVELITRRIHYLRGERIMLDADLAELYGVLTKNLNLAVRRNRERFPPDFMFQLTKEESESLRLQIATSNVSRGGRRYQPYAFTEHGVAMLSSVLRSDRAVQMNILIVRAFIKIRELLAASKDLAARVEHLEASQKEHASIIGILAEEIDDLKLLPEAPKRRIGYKTEN